MKMFLKMIKLSFRFVNKGLQGEASGLPAVLAAHHEVLKNTPSTINLSYQFEGIMRQVGVNSRTPRYTGVHSLSFTLAFSEK